MAGHKDEPVALLPMSQHNDPEAHPPSTSVKSINTRLDFTVLLLLAFAYAFNGLDKSNLTAVAAGSEEFMKQANLTLADITNSVSYYSASWVLCSFGTVIAQRTGIKYYLAAQIVLAGAICAAHAAIRNRGTLVALRVLLGMAEAAFTGNAFNLLAGYYAKYSLGVRFGFYAGAFTLGGAFGGLISYGLLQVHSSTLASWQLVFIFEGVMTIFLGLMVLVVFPTDLENAWFLRAEQKEHISLERAANEDPTNRESVSKADISTVLKKWRIMLLIVSNVCLIIPVTGVTSFLVLIVKGMGYSGPQANLMSVPPFAVATATVVLVLYVSDRTRERPLIAVASLAVAILGFIVVAVSKDTKLRYVFLAVCSGGVFAPPLLSAALLANMSTNERVRSVVMGINGFANVGSVIAGQVFQAKYAPDYGVPVIVTACLLIFSAVSFLVVRFCPNGG
ncbi:hypothetical protein diail_1971 [Diaporthe ilicicola]|nr:hypothetical protein diail_1971 [Diaporthe ilicicola]